MKRTLLLAACAAPLLGSCVIAVGNEGLGDSFHYVKNVEKAVCIINGTAGNENVRGTVTFTESHDGVMVEARITGLAPGSHGFHVHQFGDLSSTDGKSAGGHFNPEGHDHSSPHSSRRHAGDLGNLVADANGIAEYSRFDQELELEGAHSIVGRAIIVHAGEDDLKSQPTGNAGARVGYGVIGIAKD